MLYMMPVFCTVCMALAVVAVCMCVRYYRRLRGLLCNDSAVDAENGSGMPGFGSVMSAAFSTRRDTNTAIMLARAGLVRWLLYAVTAPVAGVIAWVVHVLVLQA